MGQRIYLGVELECWIVFAYGYQIIVECHWVKYDVVVDIAEIGRGNNDQEICLLHCEFGSRIRFVCSWVECRNRICENRFGCVFLLLFLFW